MPCHRTKADNIFAGVDSSCQYYIYFLDVEAELSSESWQLDNFLAFLSSLHLGHHVFKTYTIIMNWIIEWNQIYFIQKEKKLIFINK